MARKGGQCTVSDCDSAGEIFLRRNQNQTRGAIKPKPGKPAYGDILLFLPAALAAFCCPPGFRSESATDPSHIRRVALNRRDQDAHLGIKMLIEGKMSILRMF
jgi:hypothetical protein